MLFHSLVLVSSAILFLYGFFPIPNTTNKFPNRPSDHIGNISIPANTVYRSHFNKTILIIIDALRWDFVTSELMPLATKRMNEMGCLSKVSVESPTVTLPRIKALTTGSVPQYIDLVRNLASSEILTDSWLHSARNKGLNIVFYGDNTWEKLFPGFFSRSEGTTSFFVWDFVEVDVNVTRNVQLEMERSDWDIMILHYLGLDHIGHVLGPFSSKIPPKLREMDRIIDQLYKNTKDALILVTGDHGMRDAGGHGGNSQAEVTVPLLTIGHDCVNSSFRQTDIPVNLAILLGLDIPVTSIGLVQNAFLNYPNITQYLYVLRYNTEILLKKRNLCKEAFDNATKLHEAFLRSNNTVYSGAALKLYQTCSEMITKSLYEASSKQNLPLLFLVVVLQLNLLFILGDVRKMSFSKIFACFFAILLGFFIGEVLIWPLLIVFVLLALVSLKNLFPHLKAAVAAINCSLKMFLLLTCLFHPLTFISTSFIEEEHYYWTYFTVTFFWLAIAGKLSRFSANFELLLALLFIRFSMDLNSTIENTVQNDNSWSNILVREENYLFHQGFFIFGLVLVFFTLIKGQKNDNTLIRILSFITLICIFFLKSLNYHNAFLGKSIWLLIFSQKIVFPKHCSWMHIWVLTGTLLVKPHNIVLIPFAVFSAKQLGKYSDIVTFTISNYTLSNCFYFLQGHRNSLASIDVSVGYIGLNDYSLLIVVSQILAHTYVFPVLFHLSALNNLSRYEDKISFWRILLKLRTLVLFFTGIVLITFRHHLFIWSVFAPKLFIESVHTGFLFIEISLWYINNFCHAKIKTF